MEEGRLGGLFVVVPLTGAGRRFEFGHVVGEVQHQLDRIATAAREVEVVNILLQLVAVAGNLAPLLMNSLIC